MLFCSYSWDGFVACILQVELYHRIWADILTTWIFFPETKEFTLVNYQLGALWRHVWGPRSLNESWNLHPLWNVTFDTIKLDQARTATMIMKYFLYACILYMKVYLNICHNFPQKANHVFILQISHREIHSITQPSIPTHPIPFSIHGGYPQADTFQMAGEILVALAASQANSNQGFHLFSKSTCIMMYIFCVLVCFYLDVY